MKTNVYVIKCDSYEKADEKMIELFALMGGAGQFVKKDEKITLKANLLGAVPPERAVTTHPAVVAAAGAIVKKEGAIPLIADSPGSGYRYNEATLKKLYASCGMDAAAEKAGIGLNMDTGCDSVSFPQGKLIKHMEVIKPVTQADGIFNLCKMKTHLFMHMTGAVKNNFGIIPGLSKVGFHAKLHDKDLFADMLLDLALYVSPRISIMDAVLAMEGDGPGAAGTPRHVGLLLASACPLALDVAAGEIMGLPHDQNPVLTAAKRRGLTPHKPDDVNIIGEELAAIRIKDYKFPKTVKGMGLSGYNNPVFAKLFKTVFSQYPAVLKNCIGCGICKDSCPEKVISVNMQRGKSKANINIKKCIRCYCCHEMCPHKAIETRKNPFTKLINL
ncbi:MAG: DUF362 domain-containing protein [Treponema sp.]|nr:DUF362 domain-containing protein [Treponema sp.]